MAVEENFPLEQVAPLATAESKSKHNYRPIYSLHKWWARRLGSIFRTIGLSTFAEANDPADVWLLRSGFMKMITHAEIDALSDEGVKPMAEVAKHIPQGVIKRISFKNENELVFGTEKSYLERMHKSTEGWETLINSLLDSGLIMTGAWPLYTEMKSRLRAKESAAFASSIYIVARKMEREPTGFYNEVSDDLKRHLNEKLHRLWEEGIGGADFFIAAIGSAIEVFGRYEKVMDHEGEIVRADRLLSDVRRIATDYAVQQILHNGFSGEITDLTRFYVLYRWSYGAAKVQFDDVHKLAMSCNIDVAEEWGRSRGFVKKEKEFVRVLGPQERKSDDLTNPSELIDVLHRVLLLWEKSKREEMVNLLRDSGYGRGEAFYRVAQAVSETLPIENKEKKLLDGFLAGRERLREEVRKEQVQTRLF